MSDEEPPPGSETPHPAQSTAARPSSWPPGVRPISVDGLGHIGVGDDGSLYWDGRPIQVARRFDLSLWQKMGAALTVMAALAAAGGSVASAVADWETPKCGGSITSILPMHHR
jgi:hypothetical protein